MYSFWMFKCHGLPNANAGIHKKKHQNNQKITTTPRPSKALPGNATKGS